ncbi:MAG: hypothetical protein B0D92_05830 [Spirochaeta sp. LUC14_002_19_P3]|nr:MAG: hypothetical protein B0D92_05830 [Spirochaeta sp. LUC14_002_19_P3]
MSRNTENLVVPFFKPCLGRREIAAVKRVMRSGWLTTGPESLTFEEEFAAFLNSRGRGGQWAAAVNSATAGLHLALEALGVGAGDRVAVPSLTFTATAAAVRYLGAQPVFIDSLPGSGNMDPEQLYRVRGSLKALIPVHLAGHPCDIRAIREAAGPAVPIIEDAAHAFPSYTEEGMAGTLGDVGVYSFYATKTITTGEGGMITGRDPDILKRIHRMRLHGIDRTVWNRYTDRAAPRSWEYDIADLGFKYNMTDVAAAIGRVQLSRADSLYAMRREQAAAYTSAWNGVEGLELPEDVCGHAWHLYIVKTSSREQRDGLADWLHHEGICCSVHFIPLHRMSYWRKNYNLLPENFPVADSLADRILSIPLWPGMKKQQQQRVIAALKEYFQ